MNNTIYLFLATLLPFLELRFSIPYGVLVLHEPIIFVFVICVLSNAILGALLYPFIDNIIKILTRIKFINRLYSYYVKKTQKKIHKYVDKYGWLGVAIFIGIPLPGSGVYSGSLAAYLIGLDYKRFLLSACLGVLLAGIIVTLVVASGTTAFAIFTGI